MLTLITHALALVAGLGGGWFLKGRFGAKAAAVVTAVEQLPKP